MKSIIEAFPKLIESGYAIEVWASQIDQDLAENYTYRKLPNFGSIRLISAIGFAAAAGVTAFRHRIQRNQKGLRTVIFGVAWQCPFADVSVYHFFGPSWLRISSSIGMVSIKNVVETFLSAISAAFDILQANNPFCYVKAAVSDSVAADIDDWTIRKQKVGTLPNTFNPERFCLAVRENYRIDTRRELGYDESSVVLGFCSQGHHRRKGFWLHVEILRRLVRKGHSSVRSLIVGGRERTVNSVKVKLAKEWPEYENYIYFVGNTDIPEKYISAFDAFLFPSYFEAFCLAEIECAALGVPLYLTRHHGTEMILTEGKNGEYIDRDPKSAVETIEKNLILSKKIYQYDIGRAMVVESFARQLVNLAQLAISRSAAR